MTHRFVFDVSSEASPEARRLHCLAALCALCPVPSGDTLVRELFSPHVDMHQRLLVLNALTAGAYEMSHPEQAPRLSLPDGRNSNTSSRGGAPRITHPDLISGAGRSRKELGRLSSTGIISAAGTPKAVQNTGDELLSRQAVGGGKTRVWGPVALRKLSEAAPPTRRNAFGDIALRWASGLLRQVGGVGTADQGSL